MKLPEGPGLQFPEYSGGPCRNIWDCETIEHTHYWWITALICNIRRAVNGRASND